MVKNDIEEMRAFLCQSEESLIGQIVEILVKNRALFKIVSQKRK